MVSLISTAHFVTYLVDIGLLVDVLGKLCTKFLSKYNI